MSMVDIEGRELKVGQEVVYMNTHWGSYTSMFKGTLTRVTAKRYSVDGSSVLLSRKPYIIKDID